MAILALCEEQKISLVASEVLEFEVDKNPHPERKAYVTEVLTQSDIFVEIDPKIIQRAQRLETFGFRGVDALHLACAEAEQVDYFCSCDDKLLKRARSLGTLLVKTVSPLQLAEEIIE